MKYLLSASIAKLLKDHDLVSSLQLLHQAGFDAVDFPLTSYCEKPGDPMYQPDWRKWIAGVRSAVEANGLITGQVHAFWRLSSPVNEDCSCDPPQPVMHDNFEACRLLGCRRLIFHPCQRYFRMSDPAIRTKVLNANVEWFRQLLPTAEKFDVEIHIENLFDHKHVQQTGDPMITFSQAEDLLYLVRQLNHPLVRVCLDTGHAHISGQDIPRMIRLFASKLGSLHLNDNFGKIGPIYEDLHMFPGDGRIPWKDVFAALHEVGFDGPLNLEPHASLTGQAPNIQLIRLRAARDVTAALMENAQESR